MIWLFVLAAAASVSDPFDLPSISIGRIDTENLLAASISTSTTFEPSIATKSNIVVELVTVPPLELVPVLEYAMPDCSQFPGCAKISAALNSSAISDSERLSIQARQIVKKKTR